MQSIELCLLSSFTNVVLVLFKLAFILLSPRKCVADVQSLGYREFAVLAPKKDKLNVIAETIASECHYQLHPRFRSELA
jgi:hypothetical protein